MNDPNASLIQAIAEEMGAVLAALVGCDVSATPADLAPSTDWVVAYEVSGRLSGRGAVGVSAGDAAALAARILADDSTPDDRAISDALREILGQAVSAIIRRPAHEGVLVTVAGPVQRGEAAASSSPRVYELKIDDLRIAVSGWADVRLSTEDAESRAPGAVSAPTAATPADDEPAAVFPENLDLILDIELPMSVRFGQTELTLDALTRLGPGSVIDLGRSADEPVDVLVNGIPVARGEVVVVGGLYGVRVSAVVSPGDRLRSLGRY